MLGVLPTVIILQVHSGYFSVFSLSNRYRPIQTFLSVPNSTVVHKTNFMQEIMQI